MKEKQGGKIKEKEFDSLSDCQYIFPDLLRDDVDGFVVNSRILHRELGVGRDYSTWIKNRIEKYNFNENVDYKSFWMDKKGCNITIGKVKDFGLDVKKYNQMVRYGFKKDYLITIQMAKYLCSIEKKEEGAKILKYLTSSEEKIVIIKPKRKEIKFLEKLEQSLMPFNLTFKRQYPLFGGKYRIDAYIEELNIAIEYDENAHSNYPYEKEEGRQKEIEKELGCKFIRLSENNSDEYNIGYVFKELYPHLYVKKQIN